MLPVRHCKHCRYLSVCASQGQRKPHLLQAAVYPPGLSSHHSSPAPRTWSPHCFHHKQSSDRIYPPLGLMYMKYCRTWTNPAISYKRTLHQHHSELEGALSENNFFFINTNPTWIYIILSIIYLHCLEEHYKNHF